MDSKFVSFICIYIFWNIYRFDLYFWKWPKKKKKNLNPFGMGAHFSYGSSRIWECKVYYTTLDSYNYMRRTSANKLLAMIRAYALLKKTCCVVVVLLPLFGLLNAVIVMHQWLWYYYLLTLNFFGYVLWEVKCKP